MGVTAALGSQYSGSVFMDGLGAYPGSNECALGFSMQLPKNVSKADFGVRAIAGNTRELDVLVKDQGTETSLQLELRLSIMGAPTPTSPTGSVMESVSANSTAIPPGASTWVRFKASTPFVQPRARLSARDIKRLQTAPGSRRFRQVQSGAIGALGGLVVPRYLVVEKDFDFVPLKPFFITLMNEAHSEKVAFGDSPVSIKRPGKGGPIAIPHK